MFRTLATTVILTAIVLTGIVPAVGVTAPNAHAETDCTFPTTYTDTTGTEVTIEQPPDRVVVLGASAAQTVWELGAEERVVGIDAFSTYLEGAESVPVVSGGIGRVDYEAALNQSPDLIIVAGNSYSTDVVTEFRRSNVTTVAMPDAGSIQGVYDKTVAYGQLLGACEQAHEVVGQMDSRVSTVREAVETVSKPSVFVDFGGVRGESARYSTAPTTFVGELVATAGLSNIVANGEFSSPFPQVSNEFILSQNPEWLIVTYTPGSSFGPSTPEGAKAAARNVSVFADTTAVQEGQIIAVNANHLSQPAPRLVRALETIVETVHPDAYRTANQTTTRTTTTVAPTTNEPDTSTAVATTTTSGDGGPGFGTVAGVVAAVILAGLLARRD